MNFVRVSPKKACRMLACTAYLRDKFHNHCFKCDRAVYYPNRIWVSSRNGNRRYCTECHKMMEK